MADYRPRPPPIQIDPRQSDHSLADSDSSDSSPDRERDDDGSYFLTHTNDSETTLCPITGSKLDEMDVDVDQLHRVTPIAKLPPELLISIFSKLTTTSDLRNCMLVSYHWALYCVNILWHRPLCNKWPNLQNVARTLSETRPTFPYNEMVKRLNLSAIANKVNNGTAQAFMNCKSIERLTLTSCTELSDFGVAGLVEGCKRLQALDVTDLESLTDASVLAVARNCSRLQGLNITNCHNVTDESLIAIAETCRQLKRLKLNNVYRVTDQSITVVARNCRSILEIDLTGCQSITSESVTALLSNLSHLRELRLPHCIDVTDTAFTSLPPKLHFDALRILDLTQCEKVRDDAIARIIPAAPRLRNLVLAKCRHITDRAVDSICKLGKNLHYIHLGHCTNLTDAAVINLVRHCNRIRYIDLACCARLTDASVRHLAQLPKLRRIGLVKCQNLTDSSILALAHGPLTFSSPGKIGIPSHYVSLERVHLSYCVHLTLKGITSLLHNCPRLTHLSLTGVQAFLREDLTRFCRAAPIEFTHPQRDVFCVFSGDGVTRLRDYLIRLAMEEAEREHQNAMEESLLDPEDSPGADTMSDDGTVDGQDQAMDLVYGPGRNGYPSISGARQHIRPRSMHNLSGPYIDMPFFDHDQMPRGASWTPGGQPLLSMRPEMIPPHDIMPHTSNPSILDDDPSWQPSSNVEFDPTVNEAGRLHGQSRRHTLESPAAFFTPTHPSFQPYASSSSRSRNVQSGFPMPSSNQQLAQTPQRHSFPPQEQDLMAFDANHEAIMSTIPDGAGSFLADNRFDSPLASRSNGHNRMNNIIGGMRALSASPVASTDHAARSSRIPANRERSQQRSDARREAVMRAMRVAGTSGQSRSELPPVVSANDNRTRLLPQDLIDQASSSPATSPSSSRISTPVIHPPQPAEEDQDVNMTH